VPATVLRPSLHELADILEQMFFIAATCDLDPRPEEIDAAACDYQADHGLSYSKMCEVMGRHGAFSPEIRERAQVIALMCFYRGRWRPWDPEGRRPAQRWRQGKRVPDKPPAKRAAAAKGKPFLEANPAQAST
jgi:hypothetical protein